MNFSISRDSFSHLLYLTSSVVERKNTMPILANVKLDVADGKLLVTATNIEVSLVGEAECSVTTPGSITVDARVLYDILRELPNEMVTVAAAKGARLELHCGASRFKINGTSADEFPQIKGVTLDKPISIDAPVIFEMLNKTMFAVSTDETRYNISGIYIESIQNEAKEQCLRFVATDGHRLALIDRPIEGFGVGQPVIIPRKAINEIKKVLEGNEAGALAEVRDGLFTLRSGLITVCVRLVDGQFPDYQLVIPKVEKTGIDVPRNEILAAAKRVSLVTTDKTKTVRCRIEDGSLTITSQSPEYGEASESIKVEKTGEDLSIGFSARYLIDALNIFGDEEIVHVSFSGDLGPGVLTGSGTPGFTSIIMPMRFE